MNSRTGSLSASVGQEFRQAELGDSRRTARLARIADALAMDPGQSFPVAMGSEADLEGLYRFVNNDAINGQMVLGPHFTNTALKCSDHPDVLAIHDTSEMVFPGRSRQGLSRPRQSSQSLFAHVCLAVVPGDDRHPLGVLNLESWARTGKAKGQKPPRQRLKDANRESLRWHRSVQNASGRLEDAAKLVHVMDREGDCYDLLAMMSAGRHRFVVRLARDRLLADGQGKISQALANTRTMLNRTVTISSRKPESIPAKGRRNPARASRVARLAVSAAEVMVARSDSASRASPTFLRVNVVWVREVDVPIGLTPVEWKLLTSESISTAADLARIVDAYRSRWVIEELFKALKTGCRYEERQLESIHALEIALAIFLPISVQLLLLRTLARAEPSGDSAALSPTQVEVLRACAKTPLPQRPTNRDILQCLAALGGHIKNNGEPGWLVLARGYEKLLMVEVGWRAALDAARSDQS